MLMAIDLVLHTVGRLLRQVLHTVGRRQAVKTGGVCISVQNNLKHTNIHLGNSVKIKTLKS
jgi:hypothetical protein